ncbi:DoxX family protein [Micromonospora sp. DT31]|uniref:DoxX family protein n=1 Tax=Micromonospora sp. DT31 TaxID=3393434 RepID=UPI003CF0262A
MKPVRSLARLMLGSIFVVSGVRNLREPERLVPTAEPVAGKVAPMIRNLNPRLPTDTLTLVRANAATQLVGGLMLATGRFTRPAALVLAGSLVPTTAAGHPFWKHDEPATRKNHQIHFLKNVGLIGGLLLAASDTEGKPGLRWRASHRIDHSRRSVTRAVRTARREAKIAVRSAATARRMPG